MANLKHVPVSDNVFRQCVFPVSFKGSRSKVFSYEKLFQFTLENNRLVTSVAWERYAPTERYVHDYGCRLAYKRNARSRDIRNDSSSPGKKGKKSVYLGSYQLKLKNIYELMLDPLLQEVVGSQIVHAIEDGEIAHANFEFFVDDNTQFDLEGTKTAIVDLVWRAAQGPLPHVCEHDRGKTLPDHEDLPVPESGSYRDNRTWLVRIWYLWRFYLLKLIWKLRSGRL